MVVDGQEGIPWSWEQLGYVPRVTGVCICSSQAIHCYTSAKRVRVDSALGSTSTIDPQPSPV